MKRSTRRGSYSKVATRGSPTTSRSPSPTTSNASEAAPPKSSDSEDIDGRTEYEKELFDLVIDGEVQDVINFFREKSNSKIHIDINKRDTEGISVLHHAVIIKNEEIVQVLLKYSDTIEVYDALLQAIKDNSMPLVVQILNWKDAIRQRQAAAVNTLFKKITTDNESSEFYGNDITPLLMAAICGHYELIELLYNKGERLGKLHLPSCDCPECGSFSTDLKKSNNRIHLLKGLTNPMYLAFMSGVDKSFDPILTSFELIQDIRRCIDEEPEFVDEYQEILNSIKMFPVELLAQCRSMEETKTLLRRKNGYSGGSSAAYPRLLLAIDFQIKEFVAHTNAQDVLYQEWIGEPWGKTGRASNIIKKLVIVSTALFFPIVSIFLWPLVCCIGSIKLVRFIASPINRFRSSIVSYSFFLVVLMFMNSEEKAIGYLGPPSHYLPWIVVFFELSHFLSFLRHFLITPKHFFTSGWNVFELINHIFFFTSITLWFALWKRLGTFATVKLANKSGHIYERNWLDPYDILFISEVSTGIASTMAGLRLLKPIILHQKLGPLQIALGNMSKDILTFVVFFSVIIFSFALGAQHLYRPYVNHPGPAAFKVFTDFLAAAEAFFWSLFTMTGSDVLSIPPMELFIREKGKSVRVLNHHFLSEYVGKFIFIVFHILCVTFLMNMLTGVMASTYGAIVDNVQVEWRYERSKIWLHFIHDFVMTPPFNLVPNFLIVWNFVLWIKAVATKANRHRASFSLANCCFVAEGDAGRDRKYSDRKYATLIRRLLQRYFRWKSSQANEDPPVSEDIAHVQQQIMELRQSLQE